MLGYKLRGDSRSPSRQTLDLAMVDMSTIEQTTRSEVRKSI